MDLLNGLIFTNPDTGNTTLVSGVSVKVIEAGEEGLQRSVEITEQALIISRPEFSSLIAFAHLLQISDLTSDAVSSITPTIISSGGTFRSDKPSSNGAAQWKLGKVIHGSVSFNITDAVEVEIDGTVYLLALANKVV